jgi:hypothetical protein
LCPKGAFACEPGASAPDVLIAKSLGNICRS